MLISVLPLLVQVQDKFLRAPGHERTEETAIPGEKSLDVFTSGIMDILNTGVVTLVVLPGIAAILYLCGFRVAGPMVGLFALGLFMARMFGAPA